MRQNDRRTAGKNSLYPVLLLCLIAVSFLFLVSNIYAHDKKPGEYQIKALFLYNFLKFIEWPANSNPGLTVCILGEDPFDNDIDALLKKTVNNKKISVTYISGSEELRTCSLVFISHSEEDHLAEIIKTAREHQVVTVADTPGFAHEGVMLNFYLEENRVRFEINRETADRSGILISSKLLNLAKIVRNKQKK